MTGRRAIGGWDQRISRAFQFNPGHVSGRVASAQPVLRNGGTLRRPSVGATAAGLELAEVMLIDPQPGGNVWGTSGGASAEAGDIALIAYAWPWQSSAGSNLSTPTGWTSLGTWTFQQFTGSTIYACLTVVWQTVASTVTAGTYETTQGFPYLLNGSTYTGGGMGVVYRGTATAPTLTNSSTDLNTGRTAMLGVAGSLGLQIVMGQSAVGSSTGARLVTNPDSSAYLRTKGSGSTIRSAMTKIDAGGSTGPLPGTTEVYGETIRSAVYTEENYNYVRVAVDWN